MTETAGGLLLFGGTVGLPGATSSETWRYMPSGGWALLPGAGPSARSMAILVNFPIRNEVLLFGGSTNETGNAGSLLGDTWTWSGIWRRAADTPGGPSPRYMAAAAYNPERQTIMMFGGFNGGALNDTWEWNGTSWSELHPASVPPAQYGHTMEFDGSNIVVFGGANGGATAATFELNAPAPPKVVNMTLPVTICPRSWALLAVDVLGGTAPITQELQIEVSPGEWAPLSPLTPVGCPSGQIGVIRLDQGFRVEGCGGVSRWSIRCIATNACGSLISEPTTVTICPADYNCSGGITIADLYQFLAGFFRGDAPADINGSGSVSVQDIYDFLAEYFSRCE